MQIGSSPRPEQDARREHNDRGISFCDTISSSKSSYRCSNASITEEDEVSSQYAGSSHDSSEDDRLSNHDGTNDDLDDKIKWFFLRVEHQATEEMENPLNITITEE